MEASARFVVLLRAVNVGGRTLPMAALRAACESCGFTAVQTYIQSGNVVLTARTRSAATVEQKVHDAIARDAGMDVDVIARSASEMKKIVAANPFLAAGLAPKLLHVMFLSKRPAAAHVRAIDAVRCVPDEFRVIGREVYLYLPNGVGRSKLGPLLQRTLVVPGTMRNWNTITKLDEMASSDATRPQNSSRGAPRRS